ncbi:hypothetical protein RN001_005969 [Aquatica leii]|uniref:Uncharacterized protein n=1 Tax=Aquatica leii TaxID=1421715 RepID=A0AAN7Q8G5_9COLE|nr:hypothetical protein RN001_005969 [Aquatica leii]
MLEIQKPGAEPTSQCNVYGEEIAQGDDDNDTNICSTFKQTKKKRSVSPIGNIKRKSWETIEKSAVNQLFFENFEKQELPSLHQCQDAVSKEKRLSNRTAVQLKSWIDEPQVTCGVEGTTDGMALQVEPGAEAELELLELPFEVTFENTGSEIEVDFAKVLETMADKYSAIPTSVFFGKKKNICIAPANPTVSDVSDSDSEDEYISSDNEAGPSRPKWSKLVCRNETKLTSKELENALYTSFSSDDDSQLQQSSDLGDESSSNKSNTGDDNMTQSSNVNYNMLKLYVDTIPHFDGDSKTLEIFIEHCEQLVNTYKNSTNAADPINTFLTRAINSITDETPHSLSKDTLNDGISILEDIINNKPNQIHVFKLNINQMQIKQETYEHQKIIIVKMPLESNEDYILKLCKDYLEPHTTYFNDLNFINSFTNVYTSQPELLQTVTKMPVVEAPFEP